MLCWAAPLAGGDAVRLPSLEPRRCWSMLEGEEGKRGDVGAERGRWHGSNAHHSARAGGMGAFISVILITLCF
jgi:hypothetical protein